MSKNERVRKTGCGVIKKRCYERMISQEILAFERLFISYFKYILMTVKNKEKCVLLRIFTELEQTGLDGW